MNVRKRILLGVVFVVILLVPRAQSKMDCMPGENWQPKDYPYPLCMPYMYYNECMYCSVVVQGP